MLTGFSISSKHIGHNFLQLESSIRLILDLISVIFPELKNIKIFSKLNNNQKVFLADTDFIFLISLMIVDGTDNVDYFLYKFNMLIFFFSTCQKYV